MSSLSNVKSVRLFKRPVSIDALSFVLILFVAEKSLSTLQDVEGSVMMALNRLFTSGKISAGHASSNSISEGKASSSAFPLMYQMKQVNSASLTDIPYKLHGGRNSSF